MESRRIILAHRSRLLREMFRRVFDKVPGIEVVDEITDLDSMVSVVERTGSDWVIVSIAPDGKIPDVIEPLLTDHPSVHFLAVTADGSHVKMRWVESHERDLDGLSLDELIATLRESHPGLMKLHGRACGPDNAYRVERRY